MRSSLLIPLLLAIASPAAADLWWPANSTIPSHIVVVGWNGTAPDTAVGRFVVTVRDLANNPVPNSNVVVDFTDAPEVRIASDPLDAALHVQCAQRTIACLTDAAGRATFTIMGAASGAVAQPGPLRVKIYADGWLLGSPSVAVLDLDGAGGAAANDLSLWLSDFGTLVSVGRGDYDGSGATGANDISVWLTAAGRLGSSSSATRMCP